MGGWRGGIHITGRSPDSDRVLRLLAVMSWANSSLCSRPGSKTYGHIAVSQLMLWSCCITNRSMGALDIDWLRAQDCLVQINWLVQHLVSGVKDWTYHFSYFYDCNSIKSWGKKWLKPSMIGSPYFVSCLSVSMQKSHSVWPRNLSFCLITWDMRKWFLLAIS